MTVGTSGSCGERFDPVTASGRSLPALMWPTMPAVPGNRHGNLSAQQVGGRLSAALVRHVRELHAGHRRQQRHEEVLAAAVARRRVVDLAGPRLHVRDELLERLRRKGRIDDEDAGLAADQRDRREVLDRVERELRVERRADRVGLRREQQRVAVGRRLRDHFAADRRARAGLVLDDDLLAPALAEFLRDHAHRAVDRAAGRERHDDAHGARRELLRVWRRGEARAERERR